MALFLPMLAAGGGKQTIRVQGLPNDAVLDPQSIAEQRVVARFQQKFPDIEVLPAEGLRIATMNPEATTIMMIAGGIAPDVIRMQFRSSDSFIRQGIAAPLDSFVAEAAAAGDDVLSRVPPRILPVIQKAAPEGGLRVYGLPASPTVSALYFNREVFRMAGLPQRAPKNWEELVDFARKIQAVGAGYHGLFLSSSISASSLLMNFVRGAGGDAVAEVSPGEWRAVFNSPEAVTAYLFYYRLVEVDRLAYRLPRSPDPDQMSRTGMVFQNLGETVPLNPQIWGVGTVPRGPSGHGGSEINAVILAVFSGIANPEKKRAAWEYVRFTTSPEADRIRTSTLVELGLANFVNPIALRQCGFDDYLVMADPLVESEFQEAMANGRPEPYGKNCNLIYLEMTRPLDRILLSGAVASAWKAGDQMAVRREVARILDHAVDRTNQRMIGHIAEPEMRFRRRVALAVVAAVIAAFAGLGWFVVRMFAQNARHVSRPVSGRSVLPWLCLLPAGLLVFVWSYLPIARGAQLAFVDYQIVRKSVFVGLDNFAGVLFDDTFWNSILATLHFAAWTLTLGFAAPITLAYILHLIPRCKLLYRTLYYLPAVISGTAVFFLWREMFSANGLLNHLLRAVGIPVVRAWTEDPALAMLSCVIPGIWAAAGPGCLIYLAALKTIPHEQFEAAEIDGAGFWQKTVSVVFPGLQALIVINFVGAVAAAFHGATNILIMTGGGPNGATEVTALLIFYEAFTRLRFGYATAMAWIIASMLIGFTILQLRRLSHLEFRTAK